MSEGQQSPMVGTELAAAQPPATAAPNAQQAPAKKQKCRFFTSRKGCRSGNACRYLHDTSLDQTRSPPDNAVDQANGASQREDPVQDVATDLGNLSMRPRPVSKPLVVSNPTPAQRPVSTAESQNPREFQINQLRRRFRPKETNDDSGTTMELELAPSDPDFPFEMDKLQCTLYVPQSYPAQAKPKLKVTNADMDKAFQDNVARGFDDIVDTSMRMNNRGTLLAWMNSLDRQLERLLTRIVERGPTIKFVANVGSREAPESQQPAQEQQRVTSVSEQVRSAPRSQPVAAPARVSTAEEKAQAEKRRATETKQLDARLGRLPLFQRSGDGLSYTVPVQPTKADRLPASLRSIKTVKLGVPQLYPLEPSTIKLLGVDGPEAQAVEIGFAKWIGENSQLNLMSQVNYLISNMHNLAKTPLETKPAPAPVEKPVQVELPQQPQTPETEPAAGLEDKPHIHVIPRPPEWSIPKNDGDGEEDSSDFTDSEEYSEDEEDGGAPVTISELNTAERGVALSFPFLELYGIELLELVGLYITIRCERCKETLDVKNIPQAKDNSDAYTPKAETCKKCANAMSVGFRRQLMHPHSNRAGYLDLDGCTVVDLLPSNFVPTCAECSTTFPAPGIASVRGESSTAMCRQCHRKMVMKIPEVKFLRIASAAVTSRDRAPRRKPKEVLGIVAGQELPRRGRCTHYAKSYRWFRFSCCAKVFPCDKCHDAETDHPNEHANRMLCGFCSREQIYRPENCGICHAILIGKAGSGFWEGGKGTRNRVLMSRKDPRKYKRRGGTTANASKKK
ncbi:hypothetical protein SI65_07200 [Aspergillus cristatus]|uniref:CHY-type domain-containing protein n=1 Tax=Aspergillus cristatus TaxID=573508 RepID=A0A1E3B983_ASPCR|nr:hypothetical protein SI65_07200 [Aspergillus cristatus]